MENFRPLFYNFLMKRFLTILFSLFIFANSSLGFGNAKKEPEPEDTVSQQAVVMYVQNDIDKAFEILNSKPEQDRSAQDWLMLGNIMQDKNKIDEAVFMYKQAINKDGKYYKAHYNLGYIYLIQEKPNLALEEFKLAVKYKPDFAYGYYNIGCAYLQLKKYPSAKYNFFKAMDLKANEPNVYYNLAFTFKKMGKEKQANTYLDIYNKMMEDHEL